MATVDDIAGLRLAVDEADETVYTDDDLDVRLEAAFADGYTFVRVARDIWREKAARYSALVDISEGGSSRSNGDLFNRALQMGTLYAGLTDKETAAALVPSGPRTIISKLRR